MRLIDKVVTWLEIHYAAPAYAGWVLIGLTICFWIAAANTMAGWLYVLSGVSVALMLLSAWLPRQNLRGIQITRSPSIPVHVGEPLTLSLTLYNPTQQTKGMLILQDRIPKALGRPPQSALEEILPQQTYTWHYYLEAPHRGLYRWQTVVLRTAAPLGLLWSRKTQNVIAEALIYPQILPLTHCPLLEEVSAAAQRQPHMPISQAGYEGATRSLRPYRWGDPMRMVHWKSSARFNEMRVRELEHLAGGYTCMIALDTNGLWIPSHFEQAIIAAASLFTYAFTHYGAAQFWTAADNLVQNKWQVLTQLATLSPSQNTTAQIPTDPCIWLTSNPESLRQLPQGSRYLLWSSSTQQTLLPPDGLCLSETLPLQVQLEQSLGSLRHRS